MINPSTGPATSALPISGLVSILVEGLRLVGFILLVLVLLLARPRPSRAVLAHRVARGLELSTLQSERIALTINLTQVERGAGQLDVAIRLLVEIGPLVESYYSPVMKGKYFNQVGAVRYSLNDLDAAFCAYTSASIWYERGKEYRLRADVENNIALLKLSCGMYADAHEHLNNAFVGCNDEVAHAQIDETRARVCLAEGHPREALEYALASAVTLKDADEKRLLFESLETLAKVYDMLKREGEHEEIARALEAAGGRLKKAAAALGYSHQTLGWKLENQYRDLMPLRARKKKPRGPHTRKA